MHRDIQVLIGEGQHRKQLFEQGAGLCPPLLCGEGGVRYLDPDGPRVPLGSLDDTRYSSRRVALRPGDVVVLFTDGVPEARDHTGMQYGYESILRFVGNLDADGLSAAAIRDRIVDEVKAFAAEPRTLDDMTVVVVKVV